MSGAATPGWPHAEGPFHAGERQAQARVGVQDRMAEVGRRVIRAEMPDQHRELFEKLPFMLLGALDAQGRPWAAVVAGQPGFVQTPDATGLCIAARPLPADLPALRLEAGAPVGLLGLEAHTRRRNRVNGTVLSHEGGQLRVRVTQSFGNCPKYIQARVFEHHPGSPGDSLALGRLLPPEAASLVAGADTFFIATASGGAATAYDAAHGPAEGVDVSHRGGRPGFVKVEARGGATVLLAPDFVGNFLFNTFGNLAANPRAGLLFVDWAQGDLLALTGRAQVLWDSPLAAQFAGAQRLLQFTLEEGRWVKGALPWRAGESEQASQLAATGVWLEPSGQR